MKKYIVLDSNIFVSFFEGGFSIAQQKGILSSPEEIIILKYLLKALDKNKVDLILPEVVVLECKRIKEEKKEELNKLYLNAFKGVEEATISPNKRISIRSRDEIEKKVENICAKEKNEVNLSWEIFKKICNHKNTHVIKLDEKILLNAYKRGLMGKKPFIMRHSNSKNSEYDNKPIHDIQPDCIIVESVKFFLNDKRDFELHLCTNDSNFFTSNEKQTIHSDIQTELKLKGFYLTLSNLLSKALGIKAPKKKKINNEQNLNAFPLVTKNTTDEGKGEDNFKVIKG